MNKRRLLFDLRSTSRGRLMSFLVCAGCFIPGVFAGTALAGPFSSGDAAAECVSSFARFLSSGESAEGFMTLFIRLAGYHLIAFVLGFSVLGVFFIPLLSLLRGFTLAFTLAVLTRLCSGGGIAAGYLFLGIPALITIPLFFLVSSYALCASACLSRLAFSQEGGPPGVYGAAYFLRFFVAGVVLLLICLGERALLNVGAPELPIP